MLSDAARKRAVFKEEALRLPLIPSIDFFMDGFSELLCEIKE